MIWAKIDTAIYRNPKIRLAGRDARDVFISIILANSEQFADGSIPAIYADPKYLADTIQCSEEEACNGLKRCVTLHLLHVTDDVVTIVGWDAEWRNKGSSNDRVKKHRAKKKAEKSASNADIHKEVQLVTSDVTLQALHVTPGVTGSNACNALDKNRLDKNRLYKEGDSATSAATQSALELETPTESTKPEYPPGWAKLSSTKKRDLAKHLDDAKMLWELQDYERSWPGCKKLTPNAERLWKIADRLESGISVQECRDVLTHLGKQARADEGQRQWFNGDTNWRPQNFDRIAGQASAGSGTRQRAGDFGDAE